MGSAVSNGVFGTYVAEGSNDIGFVWARKGDLPVAVGPAHNSGDVWKYCGTVAVVESGHLVDAVSDNRAIGVPVARISNRRL